MKILHLSLLGTVLFGLSISPASAGAEIAGNTPTTNESTIAPVSATQTLSQQAGVIQNNTGIGTLGTPNCTGTCFFTLIKLMPNGSSTNYEASVGAIWQISSPENTQAQAMKIRADSDRENMVAQTDISLVEKLSAALAANNMDLANAIAIMLAKRWGYSDYRQLIRDIRDRGTVASTKAPSD
jgi:NACalpha-BTF3-like transcription factor